MKAGDGDRMDNPPSEKRPINETHPGKLSRTVATRLVHVCSAKKCFPAEDSPQTVMGFPEDAVVDDVHDEIVLFWFVACVVVVRRAQ